MREDLYHRLSVVTLRVPPLRERAEDIPELVHGFLSESGNDPDLVDPGTMSLLRDYAWPGNVRELRNVIARVISLGTGSIGIETSLEGQMPSVAEGSGFREAKDRLVRAFERDYLTQLLVQCQGNVSRAATLAKLDRVYLYTLLKRHQIDPQTLRNKGK